MQTEYNPFASQKKSKEPLIIKTEKLYTKREEARSGADNAIDSYVPGRYLQSVRPLTGNFASLVNNLHLS